MPRILTQLTTFCFIVVLIGQLGFKALAYLFDITHPSWIFWIFLYGMLVAYGIRRILLKRTDILDLLFITGLLFAVGNYGIFSQASPTKFAGVLATIWLGPYLLGRRFGQHICRFTAVNVYVIAAMTILLVIWQIVVKPEIINNDRLILFAPRNWDGVGGDGTMAYIGLAVGAACMVGFVHIQSLTARAKLTPAFYAHLVVVGALELFLLWFGSRSSLVAVVLSCALLTLFLSQKNGMRKYTTLLFLICIPLLGYPYLSSSRADLISQAGKIIIPLKSDGIAALLNLSHDIPSRSGNAVPSSIRGGLTNEPSIDQICKPSGNSSFSRMIMVMEAARLLIEHPGFGVGVGNFGFSDCETRSEFASPHNMLIHLLVDFGLIGALPWILLFLIILYRLLQMLRISRGQPREAYLHILSIWLFAMVVAQISGNVYIDFNIFMLTGAAVTIVRPSISRQVRDGFIHENALSTSPVTSSQSL